MDGTILLRTLTEKSIIPAGKNAGLKVGEVLQIRKIYLIYAYFNYANITFIESVLDKLNIKSEHRIEKPGKCPEKFQWYGNRNSFCAAKAKVGVKEGEKVPESLKTKVISTMTKTRKSKFRQHYKNLIEREKIRYSKAAMQSRNHGH